MKEGIVKLDWEFYSAVRHRGFGTGLAYVEEPVLMLNDVSQKFYLEDHENIGISSEDMDQEVVKEDLYQLLIKDMQNVDENLWPDIDDLVLRWLPGHDRWTGAVWIEARLVSRL